MAPQPEGTWTMSIAEFLARYLQEAKDKGIRTPVLCVLSSTCDQARAVYGGLTGEPMPPVTGPGGEEYGPTEVAEPAQAARLLREHCGGGGLLAARHLENPDLSADYYFVAVACDGIRFGAWKDGEKVAQGVWGYEPIALFEAPPESFVNNPEPSMMVVSGSESARPCRVFGATGLDAMQSVVLLSMVSAYPGFIQWPDPETGNPARLRVTPELVRDMLLAVYTKAPDQVVEAVRALKEAEPEKADWLMKLMRNHPPLLELYGEVRRGLSIA